MYVPLNGFVITVSNKTKMCLNIFLDRIKFLKFSELSIRLFNLYNI